MLVLDTMDEVGAWSEPPLVRAMAELSRCVLSSIVVRSPVVEAPERTESRATHELVARFGIKLLAPFKLLSPQRRRRSPLLGRGSHHPEGPAPFARPLDSRPKRA